MSTFFSHQMVLLVSWQGGGSGTAGGDGPATHWPHVCAQLVCIHKNLHLWSCKLSFSRQNALPLVSRHGGAGGGGDGEGLPPPPGEGCGEGCGEGLRSKPPPQAQHMRLAVKSLSS